MTRSKHQALLQTLLAAYPSHSDLRIIGSTGETLAVYLAHEYVTPFHRLQREVAVESERLWGKQQKQPQNTAETHPVLIARQMLMLACVLQHLHVAGSAMRSSKGSYRKLNNLSRPPRALARRLAKAATTLVTAHERFTSGTIDGLECLWLEAMYHEHNGNLRQSWLTCRRAISAAQLVGLPGYGRSHTPQPRSTLQKQDGEALKLQQLWLCLVHSELALCLALGMWPSAFYSSGTFMSVANSATTENDATLTSKLELRHTAIASRLIKMSDRDPASEDLDAALQIHTELEDAAAAMPSAWWIMPSLAEHTADEDDNDKLLFGTVMKLRAQILHSYLLLLAHLPAMLQAICIKPTTTTTPDRQNHHPNHDRDRDRNHLFASSRSICIEASRDLLRRFIHLRSCERTAGCLRLLDHYAWQAAAALLVTYLLDRPQMIATATSLGVFDHRQHLSDRAMASEAIDRMRLAGDDEQEDGENGDMHYYYSSGASSEDGKGDVLTRLLALEAGEDAVVVTYRKPGRTFLGTSGGVPVDGGQETLVLPFPFIGHVSIVAQIRHRSAVIEGRSRLSGTMGCFPVIPDNKIGPHGSAGDNQEEEEDDEEANLMRAMKQRRSAKWPIALYMFMLQPVR